jgi:threonine/homoserine/homoserine lactone efflux protein
MWSHSGMLERDSDANPANGLRVALRGIVLNLLNPKLTVFFFAFIPQFLSVNADAPALEMILLSAIFMLMTAVVFVCYALLASRFSQFINSSPRISRWIQRSFAGILAVFAVRLAVAVEE